MSLATSSEAKAALMAAWAVTALLCLVFLRWGSGVLVMEKQS